MPYVDWEMQGTEFANCSCDVGCPCQFNAPPSKGHCHAHTFIRVERGHFGDVPLDGLHWGILVAWPAAIHKGNGTFVVVVDERADARQRAALEAIGQGRETEPGTLVWQVFSTTITKLLPTIVAPIDLMIDPESRTGSVKVPGMIDSTASPIKNPVTGDPHRIRVVLPKGFEFTEAEFAAGHTKVTGPIPLDFEYTHAHLARIHWNTHGVVR